MSETGTFKPARACGDCTLCCKISSVPPLKKPANVWCEHCTAGPGCAIYETRPEICRDFYCGWVLDSALPEAWQPKRCGMILVTDVTGRFLDVHVDEDDPNAWRRQPYYAQLRAWARASAPAGGRVRIKIGQTLIQVLPDSELTLRA